MFSSTIKEKSSVESEINTRSFFTIKQGIFGKINSPFPTRVPSSCGLKKALQKAEFLFAVKVVKFWGELQRHHKKRVQ